ncbi:MAG: signal recognition particle protein [Gemmatales bacterium]|nr:signal recognition particle protein [Gemmatales bacterium]MDW7995621.1 signal recognition particle protein [Gemmatales bacterium]
MFQTLQKALGAALQKLTSRGRLTESNIREGLEEVRRALLEADVNYHVVQGFIERVAQKAIGQQVIRSINPSHQIVKIVYDELVQLMGPVDHRIPFAKDRPTVIMLCGLQGSGKTTTAAKLALMLKQQYQRKPLLVAADLQRPAAVEQLVQLGQQIGVPVYREDNGKPLTVCQNAVAYARKHGYDTVILDTAGRLHIAEMPMEELREIDRAVKPDQVYLVCDALTGQDAAGSAKAFHEVLELNGVILTKLDGDARGGAALSIKEVTQVPIKWVGLGEKIEPLEPFYPERMARRILGQGDLILLVQMVARAQEELDQQRLRELQEKAARGDFTLEDFRAQLTQLERLGIRKIVGALPGMEEMLQELGEDPEQALRRIRGMIDSMTPQERRHPEIIDLSRRRRIAQGSGTEPHEVKKFLDQFEFMRGLMRQVSQMSLWERIKLLMGLTNLAASNPQALQKPKVGTGHRKSAKERAKERKKKRRRRG